jgi:hypothetical protein
MFKNTDFVALAFGTVAACSILAMVTLSPVSARGSFEPTSTGYLPAQIENHGTAIESVPADSFGYTGLSTSFPVEAPVNLEDAAPQMYS